MSRTFFGQDFFLDMLMLSIVIYIFSSKISIIKSLYISTKATHNSGFLL